MVFSPTDIGALSITKENASKVKIVLDSLIAEPTDKSLTLAARVSSSSKTAFIKASDLVAYFESVGAEVTVVDFAKAAAESSPAPAPKDKAVKQSPLSLMPRNRLLPPLPLLASLLRRNRTSLAGTNRL